MLVIADHAADSNTALRKAGDFINFPDTRVTVLAFIDTSGVSDTDISHSEKLAALTEAVRQYLDNTNTEVDILSTPDIATACASYCRQHDVSLVIKAGHRSESLTYTPLDWQLIRQLPCPVIVAADQELSGRRRLLVALDIHSRNSAQKELDRKVLYWAGAWARDNHFSLYIGCCVEASEPLTGADTEMLLELETRMRPKIEPEVRELLSELGLSCKGILVSAGSPEVVLRRLADELDADLVAMGYTSRHGLGNLLVGHTAEKVLHRLNRSLAVVQDHADSSYES